MPKILDRCLRDLGGMSSPKLEAVKSSKYTVITDNLSSQKGTHLEFNYNIRLLNSCNGKGPKLKLNPIPKNATFFKYQRSKIETLICYDVNFETYRFYLHARLELLRQKR